MADDDVKKRAPKRSYSDGRHVPRKKMLKGKIVSHQAGIPRPQRSITEVLEIVTKICALYGTGKYTLDAICKKFHVSRGAFNRWCAPSKDLAQMLVEGKPLPKGAVYEAHLMYKDSKFNSTENYQELIRDKARIALMKKVDGHQMEEVTERWVADTDLVLDKGTDNERPNPNFGKLKLVERKLKSSTTAPDTAAVIFALTNTDSDNFKDRKYASVDNTIKLDNNYSKLTDEEILAKKRKLQMQLNENTEDIDFEEYPDK